MIISAERIAQIERLAMLVAEPPQPSVDVVVIPDHPEMEAEAELLVAALRRGGVSVATAYRGNAKRRAEVAAKVNPTALLYVRRADDPAQRLRNLQAWGGSDRNWWDVPYHFLLDLDGRVFEGRDWHFQGETNTTYDPGGHFLISMIGNYDVQEPSAEQLNAIADLMTWALKANNLPIDRIGGHYHYAETGCPGKFLRRYLEDGTLRRMVRQRLTASRN